jgi:hypothetical protein
MCGMGPVVRMPGLKQGSADRPPINTPSSTFHGIGCSRVRNYSSAEEFLIALRQQIDRWCDQRHLSALRNVLPGYLAINGLGDGWSLLYRALKATRGLGHAAFTPDDWDTLNDLIHASESIAYRKSVS